VNLLELNRSTGIGKHRKATHVRIGPALQYGRNWYSSPQVHHGINLDQALGSQLFNLDR
jgi:hypothetical protein